MAVALETVVKQLKDSGIISPGKLENFIPPKAHPKDAAELARELVKTGNLTPFQAHQVLNGKVKALFLGNYTILDKIGAGGMGQVFKAQHRRMDRLVALKMLPAKTMKDAPAIARFEREVRAAAKLRHPNIVAADDADEANGNHFLVMEYIEGRDLSALVKKDGPFSVQKAVNCTLQAARGLEFAHSERVVHRDIKPANLLLDKKGVVKILDMGLARIESTAVEAATQAELTGTGAIMGTVDYMAPEQGVSTRDADARADIYSLGCTLHFLLIGKPVYDGESVAAKLLAHHQKPIPSLRKLREEVPEQVDVVFQKMVAKKIEDRYQSMTEVIAAFQASGAGHDQSFTMQHTFGTTGENNAFTFLREAPVVATTQKPQPTKKTADLASEGGFKNKKPLLIGAGAAAFLAVLLGVIVIIKNHKGEEIGRLKLPAGQTAEIQTTAKAAPASIAKPAIAPFDAAQAKAHQAAWAKYLGTKVETTNSVGMRMTLIPPAEFLMGGTPEQVEAARKLAQDDKLKPDDGYFENIKQEMPQHRVILTKPFLMGSTEVTVGQFKRFTAASSYQTGAEKWPKEANSLTYSSPDYAVTDDAPATVIGWDDAVAYCKWLSDQEQATYRLPTEAEWEYACRAGTTTLYSFGDDKASSENYGWFNKNSDGKTHRVGLKEPNPFGLFDMYGNASEWCQDFYGGTWYEQSPSNNPTGPNSGPQRVIRGGSWRYFASQCRSASRIATLPVRRYNNIGFRIVRSLDPATPEAGLATTATTPTVAPATPTKPWESPAFQQWIKDVQALPAEKQVEAVSKKLMELNPGFDGKIAPYFDDGGVWKLALFSANVADISPVRALVSLKDLRCNGTTYNGKCSDLSPLQGMPLTVLTFAYTQVSDLSPLKGMLLTELDCGGTIVSNFSSLRGMPLTILKCGKTRVSELSFLQGMRLTVLLCANTTVSDLSLLRGMPLTELDCCNTKVADLSPLQECKDLKSLIITNTKVTPAAVASLQKALPNCKIEWDDPAKPKTPAPAPSGTK